MSEKSGKANLQTFSVESLKQALSLITPRDRLILLFVVLGQAALGLLDLLSIALFAFVVGLSIAQITGGTPQIVTLVFERVGIQDVNVVTAALLLAVVAALLLIAKSGLSFWLTYRAFRFLANRQAMVAGRLAAELLQRPLLYIQKRTSQETAFALTTGVNSATLGVLGQFVVIFSEVAFLFVLCLGLLLANPVLAIFTYVYFFGVGFLLNRLVSLRAQALGLTAARADIASLSAIQNALSNFRQVVVTSRGPIYVREFQNLRWTAAKVQADLNIVTQVPKYVFDVALIIGGMILIGAQALTNDLASGLAVVAIFYLAATRIMPSLLRLQGAIIDLKHSYGNASHTFNLARELDDDPSVQPTALDFESNLEKVLALDFARYEKFIPDLSLHEVSFTYPGKAQRTLDDISFKLDAGKLTAIVGITGAGKSTLADLALGVLNPDSGTIRLSGMFPLEAVARWPGAIGYVPQETSILSANVRQNVALGIPPESIDDARIWEALERAHLAEYIRTLDGGLDSQVGERGAKFSGGQRQRLGIARALYTRPKFLVLDEATSALDTQTENSFVSTLKALSGDVTQLVIAHRLSTIRFADQVVYLEEGRLVAKGSFEEVRSLAPGFDEQARLSGL